MEKSSILFEKMKHKLGLVLLAIVTNFSLFSQKDTLSIFYYENYPYAYTERTNTTPSMGQPKGIEIEIIEEYVKWLKQKKGISITIVYSLFTDFGSFYNSVKEAKPIVVGLGSVTRSLAREKEVSFSAPYLMNQAALITHGSVVGIKDKTNEQINKILGGMSAITVARSSHEVYLNELKNAYLKELQIAYTAKPSAVLDSISANKKLFGYSDLVSYWTYLKSNPNKLLKMQKAMLGQKEEIGFILPKNNKHGAFLDEFFESGFGFTSTKAYRLILEAHLGYEILEYVEVR